ncbi:MAG: hypothetical protein IKD78_04020, partial [Bacteroidales bacterium]|nr:hypothetical protein [Bacteroidales bacterium]
GRRRKGNLIHWDYSTKIGRLETKWPIFVTFARLIIGFCNEQTAEGHFVDIEHGFSLVAVGANAMATHQA